MSNFLYLDLETRSACDLRKEGGRRYAAHPSTKILTAAWIHLGVRHVWLPISADVFLNPGMLKLHLPNVVIHKQLEVPDALDRNSIWCCHNASEFDRKVWENLYPDYQPLGWEDSCDLAKQHGWPAKLDNIGKLIRGEGKQNVKKSWFDATKKEPGAGDLILVAKYNLDDVEIMQQFMEQVPEDQEPQVTWAHRRINDRGIRVDIPLLMKLRDLCVRATEKAVKECARLSNNTFPTLDALRKRTDVIEWLQKQDVELKSLDKKQIEAWIDEEGEEDGNEIPENVIPFLRSRMEALRITSGKLDAALCSIANGRIDGILNYCGAGTTGRWSSRRIQIHNLPRPSADVDPWAMLDNIDTLDPDATMVSSLLRFIFLPDVGDVLAACDYSQIECRGLNWFAGEEWVLDEFRNGRSPYDRVCEKLFGSPPTSKKDPRRYIAKTVELACGYQLSVGQNEEQGFRGYCRMAGVDLEAAGVTAAQCVYGYRHSHPRVTDFWDMLGYASVKCMKTGERQRVRQLEFRTCGWHLYLYLPSGRRITFRRARIVRNKWDREQVSFWSHHGFWDFLHGGKLAGIATQGSMRDLLAAATVRLEKQNFKILAHCHDEIMASVKSRDEARSFAQEMVRVPEWAKGLPVQAECDILERYAKSARRKEDSFIV